MHIIYMLAQLAPCLCLGYIIGKYNDAWSSLVTRLLVKYGIPTSLMGLLLRTGLGLNLIKAAAMALLAIGLLIAVISKTPQLRNMLPSTTLKLGSSFGNTGYFGIPVAFALLPLDALTFSIGYDLGTTLVIWGLAPIFSAANLKQTKARFRSKHFVNEIISSPAVKGLLGALIVSTTPWVEEIALILWIPSKIVIYLALIVVGMKIATLKEPTTPYPITKQLQGIKESLLIKLIGLPTLMLTICLLLNVPDLMRNALVLQAAAPTAISVLLVEQTSYSDRDEATKLVALTTLISFITIPSWATILRV